MHDARQHIKVSGQLSAHQHKLTSAINSSTHLVYDTQKASSKWSTRSSLEDVTKNYIIKQSKNIKTGRGMSGYNGLERTRKNRSVDLRAKLRAR